MAHPVTRRRLLLGLVAAPLAACTPAPAIDARAPEPAPLDPQPDALAAIAEHARRDAATATALAGAAAPGPAAVLRVLADERTLHAAACEAEITRAAGTVRGTPVPPAPPTPASPSTSTTPSTPPAASTPPGPYLSTLRADLDAARAAAEALAASAPAHRAGLLGSVAAACAVQLVVLV